MSEFIINGDMFGMYAKIPTGFSKEMHIYKIVSAFESNAYCNVPLLTIDTKETTHDKLDTVLNVIHCGIDESEVVRVALKDCEIIKKEPQEQPIIDDKAKLKSKLMEYFAIGDSFAYNCTRCNEAWAVGTMSLNNFEQFTEENIDDLIKCITKKEV